MIPKTVKDENVRKTAPLEKKDTVLYVGSNGDHTVQVSQDGELAIRRIKVYACALVVITIVCFAGTLTALALAFDRVFGLAAHVRPITINDAQIAPTQEPAPFIGSQQPIKTGDVFPKPKSGNSDLEAVNGTDDIVIDFGATSDETGSTSPAKPNGNEVAEGESTTTTETIQEQPLVPTEDPVLTDDFSFDDSPISDSSSSYHYGRTWLSSSFPYDGFYMRGDSGEPPERRLGRKYESSHPEESASGESDLEDEASTGESSFPSSSISFSDPYIVSE